ncbi:MAG: histidine phosphatase family protein [Desulfobacterales bacterium]
MQRTYYFIRHAVPINDAGLFSISSFEKDMLEGTDLPLSDIGKKQARDVAETIRHLSIQHLVSSTLKRAVETAEIIAERTGIPYREKFEELVEFSMGAVSHRQFDFFKLFIKADFPKQTKRFVSAAMYQFMSIYYLFQWYRGKTRGGDAMKTIYQKTSLILKKLDDFPETHIAVVGHGYWIFFLALNVLGGSRRNISRLSFVKNCSITRIDSDGLGRYRLIFFAKKHRC